MAFSGQLLQHRVWSKPEFTRILSVPPLKASHEAVTKVSQQKLKIRGIKSKYKCFVTLSMLNPENGMSMFSPSNTIKKFYSSINNKDMNQLEMLIAKDCFYDDFSYTKPFRGKKVTSLFLTEICTVLFFCPGF